ncbi:MAG: ABATE domain-containing protein [Acidobacteriota bacterium]
MLGALETLARVGNSAALDFVNTVHDRFDPNSRDYLSTYEDLLRWARLGHLISSQAEDRLALLARLGAGSAERVLADSVRLRESLHRLFLARIGGNDPRAQDLSRLNGWLSAALRHRRLLYESGGYRWSWEQGQERLESPLWPVVIEAGQLLESKESHPLKQCPEPDGCGWLFLDTSKNRTRRWCQMKTCGNAAKARRHYHRHKKRSVVSDSDRGKAGKSRKASGKGRSQETGIRKKGALLPL